MGGYIGSRSVVLSTTAANVQDVTATDTTPEVTIVNTTHEDTDGGREGKVIFKGQQSGGEESTLAEIEANHSGSADDEKGQLIFRTNDGSDGASPTEAMRIDSSQNVGIGCVPNSIQSGFDTLQIGGNLTLNVDSTGAGAGAYMGNNVYRDSGNSRWEYSYTDEASQYLQAGGEHIWRYAASGTADTAITWSEAMRIDSSGNVGIGVTPVRNFHLHEAASSTPVVFAMSTNGTGATTGDGFNISLDGSSGAVNLIQRENAAMQFYTNGGTNERMRIDSNGTVLVGATTRLASASTLELHGSGNYFIQRNTGATAGTYWRNEVDTNNTLYIVNASSAGVYIVNGGTSFSSLSDETLKENITDVGDVLDKVKSYRTSRFNWVGGQEDDTRIGFIAQDWVEDFPEVVSTAKDDKLGLNYTETIPVLLKAIQELSAKNDALETQNTTQATQIADLITRVTALEAE